MDYEKKYKEALKIAKEWHKECESGDNSQRMKKLESMFSELAESEDEKIRKEMIAYMKHPHSGDLFPKAWIDWLEKQKEQKPEETKPHLPDGSILYDRGFEDAQEYISKRGFDVPWNDCDVYVDERHITQTVANVLTWADEHPKKPVEWSEVDEKNIMRICDVIYDSELDESVQIYYMNWLKSLHPQKLSNVESNGKNWKPKSFDEACAIVRANPVTEEMTYEERLAAQKRRFGL